jgi:hypothetical protein
VFCPNCRSEYRKGFSSCPPCGGIALVEELPELNELSLEDLDQTKPVGLIHEISREVEIDGRTVDLLRAHFLRMASELKETLHEGKIAAVIVPLQMQFPDDQPRFEVRVRNEDHARAEALLRSEFQDAVAAEGGEGPIEGADAETCPACGAHVPLEVEECPECGLNVGGA